MLGSKSDEFSPQLGDFLVFDLDQLGEVLQLGLEEGRVLLVLLGDGLAVLQRLLILHDPGGLHRGIMYVLPVLLLDALVVRLELLVPLVVVTVEPVQLLQDVTMGILLPGRVRVQQVQNALVWALLFLVLLLDDAQCLLQVVP